MDKRNQNMTIRYEANPPKILSGVDTDESVQKFVKRIQTVADKCDAIHLTENVLGHQRVSPIKVGEIIKREIPDLAITASLRVRDKNEDEISRFVEECIRINFSGILVLMGDPSQTGKQDSGQIPSSVIKRLKDEGYDSKIDLYLSISNRPNLEKMQRKLETNPKGFITQVVQNIQQVRDLSENLKEFKVIPIVLFPSKKNKRSAEFLKLDLDTYNKKFEEFVKDIHDITGDIIITSPNDFSGVNEFLERLSVK